MADTGDGRQTSQRVPAWAAALGGAGLLPPAIAILVRATAGGAENLQLAHFAMMIGLQYVLLILSFLGGLWWGAAARLPAAELRPWLLAAILPSLAALALFVLSNWFPGPSAVLLALAVTLTLVADRRLVRSRLAPRWWMRLRVPLSLGLASETLVLAALL